MTRLNSQNKKIYLKQAYATRAMFKCKQRKMRGRGICYLPWWVVVDELKLSRTSWSP